MHTIADGTRNLEAFFEEVKSAGFLKRLFSWGRIKALSYEAYKEYGLLVREPTSLNDRITELLQQLDDGRRKDEFSSREIDRLKVELAEAKASCGTLNDSITGKERKIGELERSDRSNSEAILELRSQLNLATNQLKNKQEEAQALGNQIAELNQVRSDNAERIRQLQAELAALSEKNNELAGELTEREKTITEFRTTEQSRLENYQARVASLNTLVDKVKEDERTLRLEKEQAIKAQMEEMKKTWLSHEARVEEIIRGLCKKHQIEYLQKDKVPFKGKPDNTLLICQEYVVFDAKSPEGDDLSNFPDYVRRQAELASKYVREKDVRKEVFLVVPSNTIHAFPEHSINLGEYWAYIVTVDSLEPIILSLRKIEDYEFAEQLSPEERDNICRIIGRLSHLTKRRIQIDTFFCEEFFDALKNCGCLPEDLAQKALDYEKSIKVNPPMEQRAKLISEKDLEKALETVQKEAAYLDLDTTDEVSGLIQEIPLMKEKRGSEAESKDRMPSA